MSYTFLGAESKTRDNCSKRVIPVFLKMQVRAFRNQNTLDLKSLSSCGRFCKDKSCLYLPLEGVISESEYPNTIYDYEEFIFFLFSLG